MEIFADAFWVQKAGNAYDEYEDACHPQKSVEKRVGGFQCAVADGATESAFAGEWARLLTQAYCKGKLRSDVLERSLQRVRKQWRRATRREHLPWYAEQKLATGAFAALVGLTLRDGHERTWSALAVGDCCLFQIRASECITSFPLQGANAFNNSPYLLSSDHARNSSLPAHVRHTTGSWQPDDAFYLMSDALAAWFMRAFEANEKPWGRLSDLGTECAEPFETFIADLRDARLLKNDDVTLLRVHVGLRS